MIFKNHPDTVTVTAPVFSFDPSGLTQRNLKVVVADNVFVSSPVVLPLGPYLHSILPKPYISNRRQYSLFPKKSYFPWTIKCRGICTKSYSRIPPTLQNPFEKPEVSNARHQYIRHLHIRKFLPTSLPFIINVITLVG